MDQLEQEKKALKLCVEGLVQTVKADGNLAQVLVVEDKKMNATKLLKQVQSSAKGMSFMLLMRTESSVQVAILVDKKHQAKLDGGKWFEQVKELLGARGGGKGGNISGTGKNVAAFSAAVLSAKEFIAGLEL